MLESIAATNAKELEKMKMSECEKCTVQNNSNAVQGYKFYTNPEQVDCPGHISIRPSHPEYQYLDTLRTILNEGERVPNRTGVDTLRILGVTHRYNFDDGFPLLTTKRVFLKAVIHELLWFLSGSQNIKYLMDNGIKIWNGDAYNKYVKWYDTSTWITKATGADVPKRYSKEEFPEHIGETQSFNRTDKSLHVHGGEFATTDGVGCCCPTILPVP